MLANIQNEVCSAENRIREYIRATPVDISPFLSRLAGCRAFLKLETCQTTGSFKLRGALNKFLSLGAKQIKKGLVTASSGNHGAAFAHVLAKFGARGTIYLPENASPSKVEALRLSGARLELHGTDCNQSENMARQRAAASGQVYVSPYNDLKIIGGQGTIALELLRQVGTIDTVLVPVGGGGLASGIAGYLKAVDENIEIIGCQPRNSAVMWASIQAGKILDMESKPTLADGTAGGIDADSITFDICRKLVDDFILVSEEQIKNALRLMIDKHQLLVEGAAALSVAAFVKETERFANKNVVMIISGNKIGLEQLKTVLLH